MQKQDIETILASQRKFFATGKTLPVSWRLEQLKKLRTSMLRHEEDLYGALKKDLGKSRMESYMCEIGLTLSELTWMEKHIRRLTREKRVPTPLAQFAARSFQSPTPYGTVLIMSPWNYPVLLTLEPLDGKLILLRKAHRQTKCLRTSYECCNGNDYKRDLPSGICPYDHWRPSGKPGPAYTAF